MTERYFKNILCKIRTINLLNQESSHEKSSLAFINMKIGTRGRHCTLNPSRNRLSKKTCRKERCANCGVKAQELMTEWLKKQVDARPKKKRCNDRKQIKRRLHPLKRATLTSLLQYLFCCSQKSHPSSE